MVCLRENEIVSGSRRRGSTRDDPSATSTTNLTSLPGVDDLEFED